MFGEFIISRIGVIAGFMARSRPRRDAGVLRSRIVLLFLSALCLGSTRLTLAGAYETGGTCETLRP